MAEIVGSDGGCEKSKWSVVAAELSAGVVLRMQGPLVAPCHWEDDVRGCAETNFTGLIAQYILV